MIRSAVLFALLLASQEPSASEKRTHVEKHVEGAVQKGIKALRAMQDPSGRFDWRPAKGRAHDVPKGATALALYTLLSAGCSLEEEAPAKALDWLLAHAHDTSDRHPFATYEISLMAMALSKAIPQITREDRRLRASALLQYAADWLVEAQGRHGGWSYEAKSTTHDHSNSQFGILGLRAAANAGIKVNPELWDRAVWHYRHGQLKDGG